MLLGRLKSSYMNAWQLRCHPCIKRWRSLCGTLTGHTPSDVYGWNTHTSDLSHAITRLHRAIIVRIFSNNRFKRVNRSLNWIVISTSLKCLHVVVSFGAGGGGVTTRLHINIVTDEQLLCMAYLGFQKSVIAISHWWGTITMSNRILYSKNISSNYKTSVIVNHSSSFGKTWQSCYTYFWKIGDYLFDCSETCLKGESILRLQIQGLFSTSWNNGNSFIWR